MNLEINTYFLCLFAEMKGTGGPSPGPDHTRLHQHVTEEVVVGDEMMEERERK